MPSRLCSVLGRSVLTALLLTAASASATACSGAYTADSGPKVPAYSGRPAELFDDSLAPHALLPTVEKISLQNDSMFRERVLYADGVARVKFTTVSSEHRGDVDSFHLQLAIQTPTYAGSDPVTSLDLDVPEGSASFFALKQVGQALGGRTVILCWKHFRSGASDSVVHWYGAPDDDDTKAAVAAAGAIREVKGQ